MVIVVTGVAYNVMYTASSCGTTWLRQPHKPTLEIALFILVCAIKNSVKPAASQEEVVLLPNKLMLTHGQSNLFIQYIDPLSHAVQTFYPDFLFECGAGSFVIVVTKADNQFGDAVAQAKRDFPQQFEVASVMDYRLIKSTDAGGGHYQVLW